MIEFDGGAVGNCTIVGLGTIAVTLVVGATEVRVDRNAETDVFAACTIVGASVVARTTS